MRKQFTTHQKFFSDGVGPMRALFSAADSVCGVSSG